MRNMRSAFVVSTPLTMREQEFLIKTRWKSKLWNLVRVENESIVKRMRFDDRNTRIWIDYWLLWTAFRALWFSVI